MSATGGAPAASGGETGWKSPDLRRLAGFWACLSEDDDEAAFVPVPEDLGSLPVELEGPPRDGFRFLWDEDVGACA